MMMKKVVGLIKGRHDLPVPDYIFDSIEDVLDFQSIRNSIADFLNKEAGIKTVDGSAINQFDYTTVQILHGSNELVVYITGLTPVVAELIRQCALNGVSLTLMHYNREANAYVPQNIF